MRRVFGSWLAALGTGVLPGVLCHAGLFALSLAWRGTPEYMGVERTDLTDALVKLFETEIMEQQLRLLVLACSVGAIAGLFAWLWFEGLSQVRRRSRRLGWRCLAVTASVLAMHAGALLHSMGQHPQVYEGQSQGRFDGWIDLAVRLPSWILPGVAAAVLASALGLLLTLAWRGRAARLVASLACGGVLGTVAAPWPAARTATREGAPLNVLVIGIDSLRGDQVGAIDGATPEISRWAQRGTRFRRAFTVLPRTMPSWASLLSGRYPHTHGIRHMFPGPGDPKRVPGALPERLASAGYRTGVVSDSAGEVFTRMELGFQHVDAPAFTVRSNVAVGGVKPHVHLLPYIVEVLEGRGFPEVHAMERLGDPRWLTDRALGWIDEPSESPFFLTVFYSCGHFPFAAPAPWYGRYTDPEYRGRSRFAKATMGGKPLGGDAKVAEEDHLRRLYLGAVSASDASVGALLEGLEARGILERTLVVITADHGETLYEHGLGVGHGDHLYGLEGLRVPLVMLGPGFPAAEVDATVRSIDVAPTLLGRLGLAPAPPTDGVDLLAGVADPSQVADLPAFSETDLWFYPPETDRLADRRIEHYGELAAFRFEPGTTAIQLDERYADSVVMAKHRAVLAGDRKLLYIPTRGGVRWELFDPARDPGDTRDLSATEPEALARLQAMLYGWMLADPSMTRLGDYAVPRAALGVEPAEERPAQ